MSNKHNFITLIAGFCLPASETQEQTKGAHNTKGSQASRTRRLCQITYRFALKTVAAAQCLALFGATVWLHPAHKIWDLTLGIYLKCWIQRYVPGDSQST